ncbi:MAG: hypothetical protein V3T86_16635 [Planctomycetota bacterium]
MGLLVAMASGKDLDPDTIAGMDAEVRGDWIRAVEAFRRVIAQPEPPRLARPRYRAAKKRALVVYNKEIRRLLKEKRWAELADCAACLRLIDPKSSFVKRALKACEKQGVAVPTIPPDGEGAHEAFPHRSPGARARSLGACGSSRTEATRIIRGCLAFLAGAQKDDGGWDCAAHGGKPQYDVGVTALAVLALLSDGPEAMQGPNAARIDKGIQFMLASKSTEGYLGPTRTQHFIYMHAMATAALAEYAILSGKVSALKKELTAARDLLIRHQTPKSGWGYDTKVGPPDTSATAWCVFALSRLELAGVAIPESAYEGALNWVRKVTDTEFGQAGYKQKGGASARPEGKQDLFPAEQTQSATAAACLIRALISPDTIGKTVRGFELIKGTPAASNNADMYYWYHAHQAFQAARGSIPADWYEGLVDALKPHLGEAGAVRPSGPWGDDGGRIYSTALCALALAAPYRENGPGTGRGKTPSAFLRTGKRTVDMAGWFASVESGIYVDTGTKLIIRTSGAISPDRKARPYPPKGIPKGGKARFKDHPYGCLLGRIGPKGKLFRMPPAGKPMVARSPGHLVFWHNARPTVSASGSWTIEISLER